MGVGKHEDEGTPLLDVATALLITLDATYGMGVCECGAPGLVTVAMLDEDVECSICHEMNEADRRGKAA